MMKPEAKFQIRWGPGVLENKTSRQLYFEVRDLVVKGLSPVRAAERIETRHSLLFKSNSRLDANLGVTLALWQLGDLSVERVANVTRLIDSSRPLDDDRTIALNQFVEKLQSPPESGASEYDVEPEIIEDRTVLTLPAPSTIKQLEFVDEWYKGRYAGTSVPLRWTHRDEVALTLFRFSNLGDHSELIFADWLSESELRIRSSVALRLKLYPGVSKIARHHDGDTVYTTFETF